MSESQPTPLQDVRTEASGASPASEPSAEGPRPRRRKAAVPAQRGEAEPSRAASAPRPASAEPPLTELERMLRQDLLYDPTSLAQPPETSSTPEIHRGGATPANGMKSLPKDFVYEGEHPVLPIPFTVQMGESRLIGTGLSVTAAFVEVSGPSDMRPPNHREVARLLFDFNGFSLALPAEVAVVGSRRPGEMTLQFVDPLGPHLPQLRHILNSFIGGDVVSLGGLLSYTGPTKPKSAKPAETTSLKLRIRSLGVAVLSLALIVTAALMMLSRATQSYEIRPVFVTRQGQDMRATTAGQVSYLNPEAKAGEVVFSINSNTGDALNFQLPCDCEVVVTDGIFEGATVLPIDLILTFFDSNPGLRVQTLISIEGLARVMDGDRAFLDMDDGRSIPVRVEVTSATNAAADRGDLFVPVDLVSADGVLGQSDIGKVARLRLSTPWLPDLSFGSGEET